MATIDFSQLTQSQRTATVLQAQFGTLQPGQLQTNRKRWWSYMDYGAAGASQINFFGNAIGNGATTRQDTNMMQQGNFGTSSFLLKAAMLTYYIPNNYDASYAGTDTTALYTEFVGGLFQAGIFEFVVNAKTYLQIPKPFLYMPPGDSRSEIFSNGMTAASTMMNFPWADLQSRTDNLFLVDPEIFIEAHNNFTATLTYPSGAIPLSITGLSSLSLKVGVILDGIEFRPVQ